jgi:two-component system NarL family sensor kinase
MENRLPEVRVLDVYREASHMLDNTVNDIRRTAHNLMPELLLKHGLSEATRIFCDQVQDNEGLSISYQHYGFIDGPDKRFELSVYRIVQELVHNVIKHAQASFALVQLSQHNDILDVTIEDNGRGLQAHEGATKGMGLESIRQRVRELQGKININSSAGSGTTVYIEFNLKLLKSLKK